MTGDNITLQSAATALQAADCEHVLQLLGDPASDESPVRESLRLAASGLIAEHNQDCAAASEKFLRVHALAVPLPAILAACAGYFKRAGDFERAYHHSSLLQNIAPGAIDEFLHGLPPAELSRYSPWMLKKMLNGARPPLYAIQPYKHAIASCLGYEEAGLVYAQLTGQRPGWQVSMMPLVSLQDYARDQALVFETLLSSAQIDLPPPDVFGGTSRPALRVTTREFFLCVLGNAEVFAKSNYVVADEQALLDFQQDELLKAPLELSIDSLVLGSHQGTVTVLRPEPTSKPILDAALSLTGIHSFAFGHWMLEFLPKLWACLDRDGFDSVAIVVDEHMPPQHLQALKLFLATDHPIVVLKPGESVRIRKLWACSMIVYMPPGSKSGVPIALDAKSLDGRAYARLIGEAASRMADTPAKQGPKKIYLTRKDSQHRRLINRMEVEAWFVEQGFCIYDFAEIQFSDQIALVKGADVVVGPHGSAFTATFFARAGTRIGILHHEFLDDFEWYSETFRALGLRHSILVGETANTDARYLTFSDYSIDLERLAPFLEHLNGLA